MTASSGPENRSGASCSVSPSSERLDEKEELIGNEQSPYLHLSIARHRSARWLLVKATPMEKRKKKRDWHSLLSARSPKREEDESGRRADEMGEAGNRPSRLRRPNGIRRVTPQVAGISALHSPGGSRSRGCVSFSLGPRGLSTPLVTRVSSRSLSFLSTCMRGYIGSPDRELAAPMFQFPRLHSTRK